MPLHDLNETLYRRESDSQRAAARPDQFNPWQQPNETTSPSRDAHPSSQAKWSADQGSGGWWKRQTRTYRFWGIVLGVIAVIAIGVGTFVKIQQSLFDDARVTVVITGPDVVSASQPLNFVIAYHNDNRVALQDAELVLRYPRSFQPDIQADNVVVDNEFSVIRIGEISAGGTGEVEFRGKFFGTKDDVAYLRATLTYRPANLQARFEAKQEIAPRLQSSSLIVDLEAPLEVASKGVVEYLATYTNTSDRPLTNLRMLLHAPAGFSFRDSDPKPAEGHTIWYVGQVGAEQTGTIRIRGTLEGTRGESKELRVEMGVLQGDGTLLVQGAAERRTRIVASPLTIRQTVNGANTFNARAGETLNYVIEYRNEGEIGLRNTIVTVEMETRALDFAGLRLDTGGAYDRERKVFTWKASDIRQLANLAPGASGMVRFAIPVLNQLPAENERDQQFTIVTTAKIDSPDVPTPIGSNKIIGSDVMQVRVHTSPLLETALYYKDARLSNTGPIPPAVGQETTYTAHWSVRNTSNDLKDAKVKASLPTGVRWLGVFEPSDAAVTFNERTNEIVWDLGGVPAGTGFFKEARTLSFRIGLTPQAHQAGDTPTLLNRAVLSGQDTFTSSPLEATTDERTTAIREDESVSATQYKVVP